MWENLVLGVLGSVLAAGVVTIMVRANNKLSVPLRGGRRRRKLMRRLEDAGLSNFFASRADYVKYRNAPKLSDYLSIATERVLISAYWMAQGVEMEGVVDEIEKLILGPKKVLFSIVIIDPTAQYIDALSQHLNVQREYLVSRVQGTLATLHELHVRLPKDERQRLCILVHRTVPMASIIALDPDQKSGRIQIDIKPYKTSRQESVSFEFMGRDRKIYELLRSSTERLIDDAVAFDADRHLTRV